MSVPLAECSTSTRHLLQVSSHVFFLRGTDIKALLHVYNKYTTAEDRKAYRAEKSQNTVTEKTNAQQTKRQNK